jgi:chemotaxis protein MotB
MNGSYRSGEKIQAGGEAELSTPPSDPWAAAGATKTGEQGGWLLSYLDVMTILFTFFVLLFAYQKAMNVAGSQPVASASVKLRSANPGRPIATNLPPQEPVVKMPDSAPEPKAAAYVVATENSQDGLAPAVAAMKSRAALREIARDSVPEVKGPEDVRARGEAISLKPALEAMARVGRAVLSDAAASEQTAQQFASLLAGEAAQKRVEIIRAPHEIRLELNDAVLFDPASAVLRVEGLALLDRLAPALAERAGTVSVEGHTDPVPIANAQFPSNWELSTARATAVTRHLIQKGIAADRLRAVGMADTRPRSGNGTPEGRAKNRRVSLVVYLDGAKPQTFGNR